MKAKEYFEKYFGDVKVLTPENLDLVKERADQCFRELADEIYPLYKKRGSTTSAMDGVIREINNKYNAISNLMEKTFGVSIWRRNGMKKCWDAMIDEYTKPKENKPEETEE